MKQQPPFIRGSKAIAAELGCSVRTVRKLVSAGKIPARHGFSGGRTSPIIVQRKALDEFKLGQKD
ncbi:helix-turn-helix domain-containing protein [Ancylobacter terrae]|uniref:helix-turn-helix domain-containing protein n=1 Tax=Ancylobacter sp. sgz301288 TaxID=3342077 RepID=UPI00385D8C94